MKKGRHRRFEEARKLKQQGPGAFLGMRTDHPQESRPPEDDEFADLAKKYGAFDDDEDGQDEGGDEAN